MLERVLDENLRKYELKYHGKQRLLQESFTHVTKLKDNFNSGQVTHKNYLSYLKLCWDTHYGYVVSPDYLWYTFLCELSQLIKNKAKDFQSVFSTSEEKKDIVLITPTPEILPIDQLIQVLNKEIPKNEFIDLCVTKFSTSSEEAVFTYSTVLCEIASNYYTYYTTLCGFSRYRVLGITEDYKLFIKNAVNILDILRENTVVYNYIRRVIDLVEQIVLNFDNLDFWDKMIEVKNCGSGHPEKVGGWITKFFVNQNIEFINAPTHITVVPYHNLSDQKDYQLISGVMESEIDGDYLVPQFRHIYGRVKQQ